MPPIPITILTGFLGSGKTTLLLSLLPQLRAQNPTYTLALLKNEFGDLAIDSQLASSSSVSEVRELLNGCICCNLIGSLSSALIELTTPKRQTSDGDAEAKTIDRVVIETSGSAFPATLAMEINRLAKESGGKYILDGVITVIDVENWKGYEDTSYTAKIQARYTDLVVFNKWELAGEARMEECLDRFGDLEGVETAWVKSRRGWVDAGVVFGVDGGLARGLEVGGGKEEGHEHEHGNGKENSHEGHTHENGESHQSEVEVLSISLTTSSPSSTIKNTSLTRLLTTAPKDEIYRIKAIFTSSTPLPSSDPTTNSSTDSDENTSKQTKYILNWAFGRWTTTPLLSSDVNEKEAGKEGEEVVLRMTIVMARFVSKKWIKKIESGGFLELDCKGDSEGKGEGKGELKVIRIN